MRPIGPSFRSSWLLVFTFSVSACHFTPPPPAPVEPASVDLEKVAVKKTTTKRLTFTLDAEKSNGLIATVLDPHGLGPRSSDYTCSLRGTVTGRLTSRTDGSRSLSIDFVKLATSEDGHFFYNWTPVIGSIKSIIPSGRLIISRHTIPRLITVDATGRFQQGGCKFTVDGITDVVARGLILKKKVGNRQADLSIDETSAINLVGSLIRRDGSWILHIPAAILKDRFDIDDNGSTLDLNFTANITAVAK